MPAAAAAVCRVLLQPPGRGFPALCSSCCAVVAAVVAGPRSDKEVSVEQIKSAELGWRCAHLFCCCRSARHYGAEECRCVRRHVRLLEPVGPWAPAELAVGSCRTHRVQPAQSLDAKAWSCAPRMHRRHGQGGVCCLERRPHLPSPVCLEGRMAFHASSLRRMLLPPAPRSGYTCASTLVVLQGPAAP